MILEPMIPSTARHVPIQIVEHLPMAYSPIDFVSSATYVDFMTNHLDALELRLSHERVRLDNAKSIKERTMRQVWVNGIEREIKHEIERLDSTPVESMTDDELFNALQS